MQVDKQRQREQNKSGAKKRKRKDDEILKNNNIDDIHEQIYQKPYIYKQL